ncbi:MAG: VOC family protein [Vitreimonas sp.]
MAGPQADRAQRSLRAVRGARRRSDVLAARREWADPARERAATYFECGDVDAEAARLQRAGVPIERAPQQQPWLWYEAWLRDPAGNAICLFNAGDNRRFPPWRLDGARAGK